MKNSFRKAQWRMLLATMFCYRFYYTGRQNFSFAVKPLQDELGLSAIEVGTMGGAMLLCYGFGQAVNGNLGDKFGTRWLMTIGAFLAVAFNWTTSFGQSFLALLIPWSLNGYVQSLGWAPGSRLISTPIGGAIMNGEKLLVITCSRPVFRVPSPLPSVSPSCISIFPGRGFFDSRFCYCFFSLVFSFMAPCPLSEPCARPCLAAIEPAPVWD